MKNNLTEEQKSKIKLALELLCENTTSLGKVKKITSLLRGANPRVDSKLIMISEIADKISKVSEGEVIELSAESLPDKTPQQKDRKKLILLLLSTWGDLQSEVSRLSDLYTTAATSGVTNQATLVKTGKIAATMKGPLGVVTIAAAGIVAISAFLNSKAVTINMQNIGCRPIGPITKTAINIPGLKLPSDAITAVNPQSLKIPGIKLSVDTTSAGYMALETSGFKQKFSIPYEIQDITYDGQSIMKDTVELNLASSKNHEVVVICR